MKKIIMLVMAALLLTCGVLPAVAEEPAEERAAAKLKGIGVLDADYSLGGAMTRGEFAKILAALYKNTTVYYTGETYFTDMEKETDRELVKAVNQLASYGVIKGYPGASFCPKEPLERKDAEVALVRMLGYEYVAEEAGGYAGGYSSTAAKIGLTAGAAGAGSVNGAVAVMLDNALDIKVLNRTDTGGDIKLEQSGETLMQSLLGIKTCREVIYAVGGMAIADTYSVRSGYMRAGSRAFKSAVDARAVQPLIGRTAEIYYYEEDGEEVACYLRDMDKEAVLTVELGGDTVIKDGTLTYDNGSRLRSVSISAAPYIIYNGRPADSIPETGETGTITCIGETSREYNILIIEDYETHVIDRIYDGGCGIVSKYAGKELPDLSEVEELYILDRDNNEVSPSGLAVNDVLSVMQSADGEYMLIRLSRNSFFGKIDGMDGSCYKDYRLSVSAVEYMVTPEFYTYLQSVDAGSIMTLTEDFYTDMFGRIAHVDTRGVIANKGRVGYLIRTYRDFDLDQPGIKVFDESGRFEHILLSDKMKYNDSGRKIEGLAACDWFADNIKPGQLIYYKVNSDGEVSSVQTAAAASCDGLYRMCGVSSLTYRSSQKCFGSKVIARSDTLVFNIPGDSADLENEECYSIGTIGSFVSGEGYSAEFYALQKDSYTADIILFPQSYKGEVKDTVVLADKIMDTINNDGDPVQRLYCWNIGGALTSFDAKDGVDIRKTALGVDGNITGGEVSLGRGDIIRYTLNPNNEICSYQMIYSCDTDTYYPNSNPYIKGSTEKFRFGLGKALGMDGTILKVQYRGSGEIEYFDVAASKVLIAERGGEITEGTISELVRGDISAVFVYAPNNSPTIIYAYKY